MQDVDLNDENEKYHLKRVTSALARRGLKPDLEEEWGFRGRGNGRYNDFQAYTGYAFLEADPEADCRCPGEKGSFTDCEAHKRFIRVCITPHAVYDMENASDWYNVGPEDRIPVIRG